MTVKLIPLDVGKPTFGPYHDVTNLFLSFTNGLTPEISLPVGQLMLHNKNEGGARILLPPNSIYCLQVDEEQK